MDEPRKASDVLLSLEEKVNTLIKIVSVYDMNIKLILDRVNKIYSYIEIIKSEDAKNDFIQSEREIIKTNADHLIAVAEAPIVNKRVAIIDPPLSAPGPSPSDKSTEVGNDKKVPVIQRVVGEKGKDLFMAEVSVLNMNKELVLKTKTNAVGKWQAYLKPGKYIVHLVKTDTETKKKIEAIQDITIPDSSTPINLPLIAIKNEIK